MYVQHGLCLVLRGQCRRHAFILPFIDIEYNASEYLLGYTGYIII